MISLWALLTQMHMVPPEDTYFLLDVAPFIYLFTEDLWSTCYLPATILGAKNTGVEKRWEGLYATYILLR